jgi:hypothetical protein
MVKFVSFDGGQSAPSLPVILLLVALVLVFAIAALGGFSKPRGRRFRFPRQFFRFTGGV